MSTALRLLVSLSWIAACSSRSPGRGDGGLPDQVGADAPVSDAPIGDAGSGVACEIQYPHLLDSYPDRPPFAVAGVDYCVGYPSGTVLADPATIAIPGVSVDPVARQITITADDVTLDGYDFASGGGWYIETRAANTRIIHSKLSGEHPGSAYTAAVFGTTTSSNLYFGYSVLDGMGGVAGHAEFLINMHGPGLTIEYSWLKGSNSDLIGRHGNDGGDITIHNNLTEQAGLVAGTHGDYLEIYGPSIDHTSIMFNTSHQVGGSTQGWIVDDTGAGEVGNNVLIGDASYWLSVDLAALTGPYSVHDNYFAVGGYGFVYGVGAGDASPLTTYTHNVDMVTGALYQD